MNFKYAVKMKYENTKERFIQWLAWTLPKRLVYWCAIRLMAHATTGKYGHRVVGTVTILEALESWYEELRK